MGGAGRNPLPQRRKKKKKIIIQQSNFSLPSGTEGPCPLTLPSGDAPPLLPCHPPPRRSQRSASPKRHPRGAGAAPRGNAVPLRHPWGVPRCSWPALPGAARRWHPRRAAPGTPRRGAGRGAARSTGPAAAGRGPATHGVSPFPAGGAPARAGPGQRRHQDQRKWRRRARAAPAGRAGPSSARARPRRCRRPPRSRHGGVRRGCCVLSVRPSSSTPPHPFPIRTAS